MASVPRQVYLPREAMLALYAARRQEHREISDVCACADADFSMSAFCGAVAACVPEPPRLMHARAAAAAPETGLTNPGGHRLFELKLEGVCNGIALGALPSPPAGAGSHL